MAGHATSEDGIILDQALQKEYYIVG